MSSTFFSIIIPTFNSSASIVRCLDSILVQNFGQYEIIIVDSLSNDNTVDIISSYAKKYDSINLISERDQGVYDAMNKGISRAKGEWLYFLGGDDTIFNEFVLQQVHTFIQSVGAKVVYGNVLVNGDTEWAKHGELYDGEFKLDKLMNQNICHQAIFYHKDVFVKCGMYNLKYTICADHDFNLRVAAKYKMKFIDHIICVFSAGGLSSARDYVHENDMHKNITFYYRNQMHKKEFTKYVPYILPIAKELISQHKFLPAFHLILIRLYTKLR